MASFNSVVVITSSAACVVVMWCLGREGVATTLDDICWLLLALITGAVELLLPGLELVTDALSSLSALEEVVSMMGLRSSTNKDSVERVAETELACSTVPPLAEVLPGCSQALPLVPTVPSTGSSEGRDAEVLTAIVCSVVSTSFAPS